MFEKKQQFASFSAIRNRNYLTISIPNKDIYLDKLTSQEIQQRIDKIKSVYSVNSLYFIYIKSIVQLIYGINEFNIKY